MTRNKALKRAMSPSVSDRQAARWERVVKRCEHLFATFRLQELRSELEPALRDAPEDSQLNAIKGQLELAEGNHEKALSHFDQALEKYPHNFDLLGHRAVALIRLGRKSEAQEILETLVKQVPENFIVLKSLGAFLADKGEKERAEKYLRKALSQSERDFDLLCLLGRTLVELSRDDEAKIYLKRAIKISPDNPIAFNILGTLYRNRLRFRVAHSFYKHALRLSPTDSNSIINYGVSLIDMGLLHQAITHLKDFVAANPTEHQARFNLATILLAIGRLDEGWDAYEARRDVYAFRDRFVPYPDWQGEPLEGKNILILSEQGIGDEILAASMFNELIAMSGRCIIECEQRLVTLYARSFPDATIAPRLPNEISYPKEHVADVKLPAMSLARWLRRDLSNFPGAVPYLIPDQRRREHWRWRLNQLGTGLKVGISWRSLNTVGVRRDSYSTLDEWGDIFNVAGVHFVNLQYSFRPEEIDAANEMHGVSIVNFSDIDLKDGIEDVAALISELDVVVSPDNTVAVLAGALNVPTLQFVLNRYWSAHGKNYHPWHPSVKLFYRAQDRTWAEPLQSIAIELRRKLHQHQVEMRGARSLDIQREQEIVRERISRGALFLHSQSFAKAKAIFTELLALLPEHPEAKLLLGLSEKGLGNRELALEIVSQSIELDPLSAEAYNHRGALRFQMGMVSESIQDFERAIELRPGYPDALNNFGSALAEQKHFSEAIDFYQRAIHGLSGFMLARYNLGLALEHLGRENEAMIEYQTVVDSDPRHSDAWNNLGNLYGRFGLHEDALNAYRKSIDADPDSSGPKINLAKRLLLSGQSSHEVIQLLESVGDRVATDHKVLNMLGIAYAQSGNLPMAIEKFKGAIALMPDYIDAHRNLGVSLQKSGRLEEAREVLGRALLLASETPGKLH